MQPRCPECGEDATAEDRFCGTCGAELPRLPTCPGCGIAVAEDDNFCGSCGHPLDASSPSAKTPTAAASHDPSGPDADAAPEEPAPVEVNATPTPTVGGSGSSGPSRPILWGGAVLVALLLAALGWQLLPSPSPAAEPTSVATADGGPEEGSGADPGIDPEGNVEAAKGPTQRSPAVGDDRESAGGPATDRGDGVAVTEPVPTSSTPPARSSGSRGADTAGDRLGRGDAGGGEAGTDGASPAPAGFRIRVNSDPSGAEIYLDDMPTGRTTPDELVLYGPSPVRIGARLEGAGAAELVFSPEELDVAPGQVTVLHLPLIAAETDAPPGRTVTPVPASADPESPADPDAEGKGAGSEGSGAEASEGTAAGDVAAEDVVGEDAAGEEDAPDVVLPVLLRRVPPRYTAQALKARIQGVVELEALVDEEGNVVDVEVIDGLPLGLNAEAERALRNWKYRPGRIDGVPTAMSLIVRVHFDLDPSG